MAKRVRSRSGSATPTRRESRGDFEGRQKKAREQDEEQRGSDPKVALISRYLAKRAEGQTDAAARRDLSTDAGVGRHEHLAELMEAADAMHDGVISEAGLSLLQGCMTTGSRELEGGAGPSSEAPTRAQPPPEPPLPPPWGQPPAAQAQEGLPPRHALHGHLPGAPPGLGFIGFG